MNTNHTHEPWATHPMMPSAVYSGQLVHVATCYGAPDSNAARIVACVNALAGMEPGAVADVVNALEEIIDSGVLVYLPGGDLEDRAKAALAALKGCAK